LLFKKTQSNKKKVSNIDHSEKIYPHLPYNKKKLLSLQTEMKKSNVNQNKELS